MRVRFDSAATIRGIRKIAASLTNVALDPAVKKAVLATKTEAERLTPHGWTGKTRKSWEIKKNGASNYTLENKTKAAYYLDKGTKTHGPRKAKRLFVPLSQSAARAGAVGVSRNRAAFTMGKDYVLAKKVRGIRPLNISRKTRDFAASRYHRIIHNRVISAIK